MVTVIYEEDVLTSASRVVIASIATDLTGSQVTMSDPGAGSRVPPPGLHCTSTRTTGRRVRVGLVLASAPSHLILCKWENGCPTFHLYYQ